MSSLNQIMLIGNLGKDPEVLQITEQGSFVRIVLQPTGSLKPKQAKYEKIHSGIPYILIMF